MKKSFLSILCILFLFNAYAFSTTIFSGYTGEKLSISTDKNKEGKSTPQVKLQAFFQGQFSFSENLWSHLELSIDTANLFSSDLFEKTDAQFGIDEISLIYRSKKENSTNYLSAYMGTYDSVGSDIFLQRYFGIQPIASKVTESWLGMAGSILYPHFGFGISDVIRFHNSPAAIGGYLYINNQGDETFMFNSDLRFACSYRYFTFDIAGGLGAPLSSNYKGEDVFLTVSKVFWHAGATIMLGNNYTNGLFIQAGLYNMPMTKSMTIDFKIDQVYALIEPRFKMGNLHTEISIYSLPSTTVNKLMTLNNTLGICLNTYFSSLSWGAKQVSTGITTDLSFKDKYLNYLIPRNLDGEGNVDNLYTDLKDLGFKELIKSKVDIAVSPYVSTSFLSGILNTRISVHPVQIIGKEWSKAFTADIGYKTTL